MPIVPRILAPLAIAVALAPPAVCAGLFSRRARKAEPPPPPAFTRVARPEAPPVDLLQPALETYRLGVGDILRIEVAGLPERASETYLTPDGRVYFDLAPGLRAEGMTLEELERALAAELARFYREPRISVSLRESRSRKFWIIGSVPRAGIYRLDQPTRLIEAIARAGGLLEARSEGYIEEMADLSHSFVLRSGKLLPVDLEALLRSGDLRHNILLRPGDYVYIASRTTLDIFVLGAVKDPRAVGYQKGLGLLAALSYAGGPARGAYYQRILIVRGSLTRPSVATVDFNEIVNARQPDVELRPGDVVWVPQSPWAKLEALLDTILDTSASTIAANEGINAAQGKGEKVRTTINIGD